MKQVARLTEINNKPTYSNEYNVEATPILSPVITWCIRSAKSLTAPSLRF